MELKIQNISKSYGKNIALKNINLTLSPGIYALLGPNGSGKSTLMNIIAGNLKEDTGMITYNQKNILELGTKFKEVLGYMPQQQNLYPNFTGYRFLSYIAGLKGLSKKAAKEEIEFLIDKVNMREHMNKKLGNYSGGMKQRILIAQAVLGNPEILILDEPTAGLDPKERIRVKNLVSELAANRIVILSTHVVSDVESVAKKAILIKHPVDDMDSNVILCDTPQKLCENIKQKTFQIIVDKKQVNQIEEEFLVCNIANQDDQFYATIISDKIPEKYKYRVVDATLEGVYLYYFREKI